MEITDLNDWVQNNGHNNAQNNGHNNDHNNAFLCWPQGGQQRNA